MQSVRLRRNVQALYVRALLWRDFPAHYVSEPYSEVNRAEVTGRAKYGVPATVRIKEMRAMKDLMK